MAFNLSLPRWLFPTWARDANGNTFADISEYDDWTKEGTNLWLSQNHPILSPALLFVSKLFSQGCIKLVRNNGKEVEDHPILDLLMNPNPYQTTSDLLESLLFTGIANGVGVIYKKSNILRSEPNALYVLDYAKIEFPDKIKKSGNLINASQSESYMETEVLYDRGGEELKIKLKDLMFFYDMPNMTNRNPFKVSSRIDGLRQTLINTKDSLIAKNIILKSNGKEIISGVKDGMPINPDEKREIEDMYNHKYGLSFSRKRGIVVSSQLTHKSLHIALRDLGLDESIKVDGNIIYTALHIPKDILSLEAKKTTYNNFKESMVSYVQNEMQSTLDAHLAVLNKCLVPKNVKLVGDYEHLPIMQFILIERYKGVNERAIALQNLRKAGLPDEVALKMVGMDTAIQLEELTAPGATEPDGEEQMNEQKVRDLIDEVL